MGGQNTKAYTKKTESILENIIFRSGKDLPKSATFRRNVKLPSVRSLSFNPSLPYDY